MSNERLELTILMPCLNEAETVRSCVEKAKRFLASRSIRGEVLVADNGSTDGSQALASACGARVVGVVDRGYGAALLGGIRAARGDYVIMGDADDSYDFTALDDFVAQLRSGFDLVMGNRFLGGIKDGAMPPLHRYLGNPVLTGIGRLFFKSPCGDFHCGLRGFRRTAILKLGLTAKGMEFASEMVVKATLHELRIAEVPTTLWPDGRSHPPHLRSWRDGCRHLRFLLLFSPAWLFFVPGLVLLMAGAASMAWLMPQPRAVGSVVLDVDTLVYAAAAMVCGFQTVAFYLFAKIYAIRAGLLPEDALVARLRRRFQIKSGVIAGGVAIILGLVLAAYAIGFWRIHYFGPLDPTQSMRFVVPSATLLILGFEVMFASFLLAILELESGAAEEAAAGSDSLRGEPAGAAHAVRRRPHANLPAH